MQTPSTTYTPLKRLAQKLAEKEKHGAVWARQFDNPANMEIHARTTGAEIWEQTDGKVDGFICAVGTGGTLAGVSSTLKHKNPQIRIGLADPCGASLSNYFNTGELQASEGSSIIEGIGINHITDNVAAANVGYRVQYPGHRSIALHFRATAERGALPGGLSRPEYCRCSEARRRIGARSYHCHNSLRLRHTLSKQVIQPGIFGEQRFARSPMAQNLAFFRHKKARSSAGLFYACLSPNCLWQRAPFSIR